MADQIILNRRQLSAFFSNPEAIKAFEQLFKYVAQTAPEQTEDISAIIASIKTPTSAIGNLAIRIELIEQQQRKINSANSDILNRIENLEQTVSKKSNTDDIYKRLQNLESLIGV